VEIIPVPVYNISVTGTLVARAGVDGKEHCIAYYCAASAKNIGRERDDPSSCYGKQRKVHKMPDVTQAEVGRRLYHIQREKRIENAIKKIQHGVGPAWKSYSQDDIRVLGHVLQCTWNTIDQKVWESIPFAHMTKDDVDRILSFGKDVRPGKNPEPAMIEEIQKILLALS
jgi:hypothetical protein